MHILPHSHDSQRVVEFLGEMVATFSLSRVRRHGNRSKLWGVLRECSSFLKALQRFHFSKRPNWEYYSAVPLLPFAQEPVSNFRPTWALTFCPPLVGNLKYCPMQSLFLSTLHRVAICKDLRLRIRPKGLMARTVASLGGQEIWDEKF